MCVRCLLPTAVPGSAGFGAFRSLSSSAFASFSIAARNLSSSPGLARKVNGRGSGPPASEIATAICIAGGTNSLDGAVAALVFRSSAVCRRRVGLCGSRSMLFRTSSVCCLGGEGGAGPRRNFGRSSSVAAGAEGAVDELFTGAAGFSFLASNWPRPYQIPLSCREPPTLNVPIGSPFFRTS